VSLFSPAAALAIDETQKRELSGLLSNPWSESGLDLEFWWALVDDLRTLPPGQIGAGIPHIGELSLLTTRDFSGRLIR